MQKKGILMLVAGANGAIGSTLALAVQAMKDHPDTILPYLTTAEKWPCLGASWQIEVAGWDIQVTPLSVALKQHGVVPSNLWQPYVETFNAIQIKKAPEAGLSLEEQVAVVRADIRAWVEQYPDILPVLINLLPAASYYDLTDYPSFEALYQADDLADFADLAYVMAAVQAGVPVVNFTPNHVEGPAIVREAARQGVPLAGRDGKTGQTYFKVVLGSAFNARNLYVNGWYSLNILGNKDGQNLMNPQHASCKLSNKTDVLNDVLGYRPGERNHPDHRADDCHKVHIDYYPPRGDSKEAWDVIDFEGVFGLPMSLRLNLQGRDSILAAPLVLDLARWMVALQLAGFSGPIPDLAFYFKKSIGDNVPCSFQDQLSKLDDLAQLCNQRIRENHIKKEST